MALNTRLTALLGVEHPVIQGGMAWTATAELASAVSNAGGFGIIGAGPAGTFFALHLLRTDHGVELGRAVEHTDAGDLDLPEAARGTQ